jgi:hypothetical protein
MKKRNVWDKKGRDVSHEDQESIISGLAALHQSVVHLSRARHEGTIEVKRYYILGSVLYFLLFFQILKPIPDT